MNEKSENVLTGTLGALGGALIGAALIVGLGQMGYVAAISGVVMAVCALKGYEMLGGKLTRRGVIIASVIMVVMTYIGCCVNWAVTFSKYMEISYMNAFKYTNSDYIDMNDFYKDLLMLYLFTALGAVPTIRKGLSENKH